MKDILVNYQKLKKNSKTDEESMIIDDYGQEIDYNLLMTVIIY